MHADLEEARAHDVSPHRAKKNKIKKKKKLDLSSASEYSKQAKFVGGKVNLPNLELDLEDQRDDVQNPARDINSSFSGHRADTESQPDIEKKNRNIWDKERTEKIVDDPPTN